MATNREPDVPRTMPAGHVVLVVIVALLGGGILNAQALTDAAARQPFGWKRTAAVVAATPFRGIAGVLQLDGPHAALSRAAAGAVGAEETAVAAGDRSAPERPQAAPATTPTTRPSPATPTETAEQRGPATRRDPLRVWVGGDSLSSEFGPALSDRIARTGRGDTEVEYRFSTGLARPDFFDWPRRLTQIAARQDPDVFVVVFGANDGQNIEVDGNVLTFNTPPWRAEYAHRVDAVLDLLATDGRKVYWIGQPVMADSGFDAKMQVLNGIYRERVTAHDNATYIDTRELFSADGAFASYLDDANGQSTLMRQQDGVHFTRAGGELLTTVVIDAIDEDWNVIPGR